MKANAAVIFISGQSNAHAHGQFLAPEDRVTVPMKNVFSLDRNPNQSFDITDVIWSGYTTAGKNLGECQDHTCCLAYYFAKRWQAAIDAGDALPDLYIVQISIGSQGIINGMWNRDKEKIMSTGVLGKIDISLFPWAQQVQHLAMENLRNSGKNPVILGWHWIGSEHEVWNDAFDRADLQERYDFFFDRMLASMGQHCPLWLYKINAEHFCSTHDIKPYASCNINKALWWQAQRHTDVHMVRPDHSPWWDEKEPLRGIYAPDDAHYLPKVQQWFADTFYQYIRCNYSFE